MTRAAAALGLGLAAASLAAGAAARPYSWADDPAASARPAYAASQAICRRVGPVAPPAADAPTPAESEALADCSSEALYYGIRRPADPKAARLCAFRETRDADPQVTDFGYTGDRMLMTAYANGVGATRDLDVALALACRIPGAPADTDARVLRLARLRAEGWAGSDFDLCQDAAGRLMRGICADHRQLVARAARAADFARLSAGWTAADRAAHARLARAEAAFADARGQGEADPSGGAAAVVDAEDAVERDAAALLADAEAGRIPPATPGDAAAAEAAMSAAATDPRRPRPASAQRAWARYRDAWLDFARQRYPALSRDALATRLGRDRAAQLGGGSAAGRD